MKEEFQPQKTQKDSEFLFKKESYEVRNLRRIMQFAEGFPDFEIVTPLVSQLS